MLNDMASCQRVCMMAIGFIMRIFIFCNAALRGTSILVRDQRI